MNGGDFMIPIKIETLLEGRKVEQSRIEYKEGFNPSDIIHTICAYYTAIKLNRVISPKSTWWSIKECIWSA